MIPMYMDQSTALELVLAGVFSAAFSAATRIRNSRMARNLPAFMSLLSIVNERHKREGDVQDQLLNTFF
jgi:pilus assembly protein TadC